MNILNNENFNCYYGNIIFNQICLNYTTKIKKTETINLLYSALCKFLNLNIVFEPTSIADIDNNNANLWLMIETSEIKTNKTLWVQYFDIIDYSNDKTIIFYYKPEALFLKDQLYQFCHFLITECKFSVDEIITNLNEIVINAV